MWLVRVALERPYTFVVLALLVFILSGLAIVRTPTDIFPSTEGALGGLLVTRRLGA
jgi:multidrug efflux pump subunit AcrB